MIYVFKIAVKTENEIKHLKPHIEKKLQKSNWNFDFEDYDNI